MMWQVITYTVAVSLAVSLIGLCEEKLAVMRDLPRRFFWAFTMVLSIAWPLGMMLWTQPAGTSAPPAHELAIQAPLAAPMVTDGTLLAPVPLEKQPTDATQPARRWKLALPSDRALVVT